MSHILEQKKSSKTSCKTEWREYIFMKPREYTKLQTLWTYDSIPTVNIQNTFNFSFSFYFFFSFVSVCFYFFSHVLPLGELYHYPTEIVPHACGYFSNRTFKHLHTRICCIMLFAILVLWLHLGSMWSIVLVVSIN